MPRSLQKFVMKSNKSADVVIGKATTHEAIEVLYQKGIPGANKRFWPRLFFNIWFNTNNPKAVRNRLRIVKREVGSAVKRLSGQSKNIRILSIAAGSARGVIEALAREVVDTVDVSVIFLDKNEKVNEYSSELIKKFNFPDNYSFDWVNDTANNFPKYLEENGNPNIVEMVGLMDYFDDEEVVRIFSTIYENMEDGGTFITANVVPNSEIPFVTKVVGWEMIYRNPEDFLALALAAGFKRENIRVLLEPLKIHTLMVCTK